MKKKITIIDYGSGNLLSVKQSFFKISSLANINAEIQISSDPTALKNSSHVVLPGQGAFKTCMDGIKNIPGMQDQLNEFVKIKKRPFFGICVGMQLLADISEENGIHQGFGWIKGKIKKLPSVKIKMPHMGWNSIRVVKNKALIKPKESDYYFVHSYYFECFDKQDVVAETKYGINFASIVSKENVYGCQFHPEKSSTQGLNIIKDFINL